MPTSLMQMNHTKPKGQLIPKCVLRSSISSKKRTKTFVFWRKSTIPKNHFEVNWPLVSKIIFWWYVKDKYKYSSTKHLLNAFLKNSGVSSKRHKKCLVVREKCDVQGHHPNILVINTFKSWMLSTFRALSS